MIHVPHTLRDYQREATDAIKGAWANGICAPLAAMATGAGKTTVMAQLLVETVPPDQKRALVIGHTKEIIEQMFQRIQNQYAGLLDEWFGGVRMFPGIGMVMGQRDLPQARIVVATRQSLHQSRLAQVLAYGPIDVLVIDEAHHAVADNTYGDIVAALRKANPRLKIAGFTATPKRADKKALKTIFDDIVYQWLIPDGIASGYLTPVQRIKVKTKVDLSDVKTRAGDYANKQMMSVLRVSNWTDKAVEAYNRWIADSQRQCLAYLPSVAMSQAFAAALQAQGVAAAHLDGTTPKDERATLLEQYKSGEINVVSNMAVLTEGFDAPNTRAILLARPTRSQSLFTQIVGRGLRISDGKDDCLLLDMTVLDTKALEIGTLLGRMIQCDQCSTEYLHGLPVCPHCGALPPKGDLLLLDDDDEAQLPQNVYIGGELIAEHAEMFEKALVAWHVGSDGYISCSVGFDEGSFLIMPPLLDDQYRLIRVPKSKLDALELVTQADNLKAVMSEGERLVKKHGQKSAMKDAIWRGSQASVGQVKLLKRFGIKNTQGMTKGHAAQLITHHISVDRIEKAEGLEIS